MSLSYNFGDEYSFLSLKEVLFIYLPAYRKNLQPLYYKLSQKKAGCYFHINILNTEHRNQPSIQILASNMKAVNLHAYIKEGHAISYCYWHPIHFWHANGMYSAGFSTRIWIKLSIVVQACDATLSRRIHWIFIMSAKCLWNAFFQF